MDLRTPPAPRSSARFRQERVAKRRALHEERVRTVVKRRGAKALEVYVRFLEQWPAGDPGSLGAPLRVQMLDGPPRYFTPEGKLTTFAPARDAWMEKAREELAKGLGEPGVRR